MKIKRKLGVVVYKRRVEAAPSVLRDFPENGSSLQAACQVAGTGASASGHTVTVA